MPREETIYGCSFCSDFEKTEDLYQAEYHEHHCIYNPKVKGCFTCDHYSKKFPMVGVKSEEKCSLLNINFWGCDYWANCDNWQKREENPCQQT
jgi:hypothetical protein